LPQGCCPPPRPWPCPAPPPPPFLFPHHRSARPRPYVLEARVHHGGHGDRIRRDGRCPAAVRAESGRAGVFRIQEPRRGCRSRLSESRPGSSAAAAAAHRRWRAAAVCGRGDTP
jgi:hypothetical protein